MSLPYSAISIIAAVVLAFLGAKQAAVPVAIGGLAIAASSVLSLKKWKAEQPSSVLTLFIGGESFACSSLKSFACSSLKNRLRSGYRECI